MPTDDGEPYPLPADPDLAEVARAVRNSGEWAWVVDSQWRCVYVTDELRRANSGGDRLMPVALEEHLFGPAAISAAEQWTVGANSAELWCNILRGVGGMVVADTPGGREELRRIVDVRLADVVDELISTDDVALSFVSAGSGVAEAGDIHNVAFRIRRPRANSQAR